MLASSTKPLALTAATVFVGLNVADAWVTKQVLAIGWQEVNPIVIAYGTNILIKGFLALVIALILLRLGKTKLLWVLNICMLAVVLWLSTGLFHFL